MKYFLQDHATLHGYIQELLICSVLHVYDELKEIAMKKPFGKYESHTDHALFAKVSMACNMLGLKANDVHV